MNIQVRKIANGYVISYPKIKVPTKRDKQSKDAAGYVDEQEKRMYGTSMFYITLDSGATQEERLEWYCATKTQVEEAIPRIALECYHAQQLKDEA
jgi:hypothetical protein